MIDPNDVIRNFSVEALLETSEEYYRRVDDPTPLMSKPFTFLHEAPDMLQTLGLLLGGLQLGKTMTVLDFGAGTCWLSRLLIQLNCRAISCDPSATALAIGERLFRDYPLVGPTGYRPTFLLFDGHHIDLPDRSVDRIICFDAFHHVPNQAEVIHEMGRVLRQGGVAGFSEPGRRHSESPQSQYEMSNHRVLENNIDVESIFDHAKQAGFTRLSLRIPTDMEMSLEQHRVLFSPPSGEAHEQLKSEIWNQTFNSMTNRAVFFLHKGPLVRDSRSHIGLAHRLVAQRQDVTARVGAPLELSFSITNAGQATWLHANDEIFGVVRLGAHLYDQHGVLLSVDWFRHDLPRTVLPGDTLNISVPVSFAEIGQFRLGFDLVAEGVTWFETVGSACAYVDVLVT